MEIINLKLRNAMKGSKYKLAAVGLSAFLAAMSLTGCGKKTSNYRSYSLTSVADGLSQDKDLTNVDEYVNAYIQNNSDISNVSSIEELDNTFIGAYNGRDKAMCNQCMKLMSEAIIYATVADGYGLELEKISDFEVLGNMIQYRTPNRESATVTEYGVKFNYDGVEYQLKAEELARDICCISRAGLKDQLVFYNNETDFDYFVLDKSYDLLKESLATDLSYSNEPIQTILGDFSDKFYGLAFDGTFEFTDSSDKDELIGDYLKSVKKSSLSIPVRLAKEESNKSTEEESSSEFIEEETANNETKLPVKSKKLH